MSLLLDEARKRRKHWMKLHDDKVLELGYARAEAARWVEEWIEAMTKIHDKAPTVIQEKTFLEKLRAACGAMMSCMGSPKDGQFYSMAQIEIDHLKRFGFKGGDK